MGGRGKVGKSCIHYEWDKYSSKKVWWGIFLCEIDFATEIIFCLLNNSNVVFLVYINVGILGKMVNYIAAKMRVYLESLFGKNTGIQFYQASHMVHY